MADQWKSKFNLSKGSSPTKEAILNFYDFCRYFFWPDVLDGLKEMFTRTQFVCDQGGYFPEIKVDIVADKWFSIVIHMDPHRLTLRDSS